MKATRDAYGHALLALGAENGRVVVLDSDLSRSTRTDWFLDRFPGRHFNMGIAEANMIGVAAGMAMSGLIPFATTYSIFIGRAFDQIRQAVCYANANVKIVATHGGLSASHDGGSHQGIEDLALMTALPNMTVLNPADYSDAYEAIFAAAEHQGPVYIRLSKFASLDLERKGFKIGPPRLLRDCVGEPDVAILSTGVLVGEALASAAILQAAGVQARVFEVGTLKPTPAAEIRQIAHAAKLVVTVEEHSVHGGLFAAVAAALAGVARPPVCAIAVPDTFGATGEWGELLSAYRLTAPHIAAAVTTGLTAQGGRK